MSILVWTYLIYLVLSIAITVWVARSLHRNGRIFLVDSFGGNANLADSVNHLLVVGFYLVNLGFVTLALKYRAQAESVQEGVETLCTKIGMVLLVLGVIHLANVMIFSQMRTRALKSQERKAEKTPITDWSAEA